MTAIVDIWALNQRWDLCKNEYRIWILDHFSIDSVFHTNLYHDYKSVQGVWICNWIWSKIVSGLHIYIRITKWNLDYETTLKLQNCNKYTNLYQDARFVQGFQIGRKITNLYQDYTFLSVLQFCILIINL